MHIIHLFEYTVMGTFAAGAVIWIYHSFIIGDSAIEWEYALLGGAIFGLFFTILHRNDQRPDHPH